MSDDETKLSPLPCWLCQRDDEAAHVIEHQRGPVMAVKCNGCGQRGPYSEDWDAVYDLWNKQNTRPARVDAERLRKAHGYLSGCLTWIDSALAELEG